MIQKDYLSEVEATYVQGQVLVDKVPSNRLTSIWAIVGKDIHGFAAVIEDKELLGSSWLVKFSPVSDIVVIRSYMVAGNTWVNPDTGVEAQVPDHFIDVLKFNPQEHAMRFCTLSKWVDAEKIASFEPVLEGGV
jgi:hypothetical protein